MCGILIGHPHSGHVGASNDTFFPQSGQSISGIFTQLPLNYFLMTSNIFHMLGLEFSALVRFCQEFVYTIPVSLIKGRGNLVSQGV